MTQSIAHGMFSQDKIICRIYFSFHLSYLVNDKLDSTPSISMNLIEAIETENINATVVVVEQKSDEQQTIVAEPSMSDESSPLLPHDRPTYEEPFTGLASFVPSSRFRTCFCCSIT